MLANASVRLSYRTFATQKYFCKPRNEACSYFRCCLQQRWVFTFLAVLVTKPIVIFCLFSIEWVLGGLCLIGIGSGLVNILAPMDMLSAASEIYKIDIKATRNKIFSKKNFYKGLYSFFGFLASLFGYCFYGFIFEYKNGEDVFLALCVIILICLAVYILLEGKDAVWFVFKRGNNKRSTLREEKKSKSASIEEKSQIVSLFQKGAEYGLKKKQFILCEHFYGKYFTGETFGCKSPFVLL